MADSILDTTKKLVGIEPDNTDFDLEIITHVNSVFFNLQQLGVGPKTGFSILDNTTTWSEYIGTDLISAVRSYMGLRVRLLFDPPATSFAIDAMKEQAKEYEWRLNVQMEPSLIPVVSGTTVVTEAYIWDLTGLSEFPYEAPVGAIGIDLTTGDVWRKS